MKIVKITSLVATCIMGCGIGLKATSGVVNTEALITSYDTTPADNQAAYVSKLSTTLNADTWARYLTIVSGSNTLDILGTDTTTFPNPATVREALYKSLQHGAYLAFVACSQEQSPTLGDMVVFQSRLTSAQKIYPDTRATSIQYVLYLTFLYSAQSAGTIAEFWQNIQYGVPAGSPFGTTIFDLIINNLPGAGFVVQSSTPGSSVSSNPQEIFTLALIKGINLVIDTGDLQKLTRFQAYFTTAQSKYSSIFAKYPNTQEKLYCGFLTATNASTFINDFWTALNNGTPTGKNIFDVILDQSYTPFDLNKVINAFIAAFIKGLSLVTPIDDITIFSNYFIKASSKYSSPFITAFNTAKEAAKANALKKFDAPSAYLMTNLNLLKNTIDQSTLIITLTQAAAATKVADIAQYLTQATAITNPLANLKQNLITNFNAAFSRAITLVTNSTEIATLTNCLPPAQGNYLSTLYTELNRSLTDRKNSLLGPDLITQLNAVTPLTQFDNILTLLNQALAIPAVAETNKEPLINAFGNAFKSAANAATYDICNLLNSLLTNVPTWLNAQVPLLKQTVSNRISVLKETDILQNLTKATQSTNFSDILPALTAAIKSPTPLATNLLSITNAFAAAFNYAVNLATNSDEIKLLAGYLPPQEGSFLSTRYKDLSNLLTYRQQQLQAAANAADAAAKENQLISNLKSATTFAAILPLLTTTLATTYSPVNATDLTSAVVTAFNAAITAATSLTELTQLSNLLKTSPAYINSNVTALTSAITQKQQQLKPSTNTTASESIIIATLKSTKTPIDKLFSTLDAVLAATYQPSSLTNIKTAVFAGITRAIALITTSNYTTAQPKISGYISSATPKYLTAAQASTLSKSLTSKLKSIRTPFISSFTSKINSFKTAVATTIAMRATPATILAQRQKKLTDAIKAASTIIDAHTQLAPTTTELAQANLKSAYTTFNTYLVKLIQDKGFIKKTVSGKATTYALAYGATSTEPKASLKKVLNFMSTTKFPHLSTAQRNIIAPINASIV